MATECRARQLGQDKWELYNLEDDFSDVDDLAGKMPEKLDALKRKFDEAAERYHVYPLDDRGVARAMLPKPPPPGFTGTIQSVVFDLGPLELSDEDQATVGHAEAKVRAGTD